MRVVMGVGVLNQTPFDWARNEQNIVDAIDEARRRGVTVLCLPELCVTGYGCEDMFHSAGVQREAWASLERIAKYTNNMIVTLGLPVELRGGIYNCAALLVDGEIEGLVAKRFLAGDGIHYEPRWFKPWPEGEVAELTRGGRRVPMGDLSFDVGGLIFGFEICEDAWVAHRPGAQLSLQGIDVIVNPSASHFAFGKQDVRRRLVLEGSRAFGVTYLYSNLLGNESGRAIFDGGGMIASAGAMLAETPRLSFGRFHVATSTIDIDYARLQRSRTASFRPDAGGDDGLREIAFTYPDVEPTRWAPITPTDFSKEEAFTRAVSLALFDYLRKSWSQGYVVSLSGGADSAACVCLVRAMVEIAIDQLGVDGTLARLSHIKALEGATDADQITGALLTTAYQATRNSGPVTRHAAKAVAEGVGAKHYEMDIDSLVEGYTSLIEKALARDLTWETDDITLQNIQARVRSPSIWMIANTENKILISTSNRSEAAVGYATMDGDTSGGISAIAGIDKAFLRQWLRWMEKEGVPSAVPALSAVNEQQPTAELRPQEESQTDEGDLMPYPILDAIERVAIRDKKMPREAYRMMRVEYPDIAPAQLKLWVEKFYKLWCRNQWKRERYAASFHLDDKNLDPKTWCRFPILSGGYRKELAALRASDE